MVWSRLLTLVFGVSTWAISTVLAAFMGGLALGAFLGGRVADRLRRPVHTYALLEIGIALYGLALPWILELLPLVNSWLWQHLGDSFGALSLVRFLIVFSLIILPSTAMGATLPILARWTAANRGSAGSRVGRLYTANTMGAVVGTLLAGFVFLPLIGVRWTNAMAAGADLLVAGLILLAIRRKDELDWAAATSTSAEEDARSELLETIFPKTERAPGALDRNIIVASYLVAGGCGMAYEVLWSRALSIVAGSSVYAFTLVLFVYLAGHALGAAWGTRVIAKARRPVALLAQIHIATALLAALAFLAVDSLPMLFLDFIQQETPGVGAVLFAVAGLIALVVLPAATVGGAVFPFVVELLTEKQAGSSAVNSSVAGEVGRAYACNTVGAIGGSLLTGFLLMPLLGLGSSMKLIAIIQLLAGLLVGLSALRLGKERRQWGTPVLGVLAIVIVLLGPDLRPGKLAAGMFRVSLVQDVLDGSKYKPAEVLYYRDGRNATVTVEKRGSHMTLKANGKPEASNDFDMPNQVLTGLLPVLFHHDPKDVALIGLGSGVSVGSALADPRVQRLQVIELEAAMVEAARFFDDVNGKPWDDPRLQIIESDGRNYLASTGKQFDVIISEPSNPWIAGVGSLFAAEHYARAQGRLKPGGIYMQWLQLYEMHPDNVKSIMATFQSAFPQVWAFSSKPTGVDLLLFGTTGPMPMDVAKLAERWKLPGVAEEARRIGINDVMDIPALLVLRPDEIIEYSKGAPLNTDDNARLEFLAPLDLVRVHESWFEELYFSGRYGHDPSSSIEGLPKTPGALALAYGRLARSLVRHGRLKDASLLLAPQGRAVGEAADQARRALRWMKQGPISVPPDLAVGKSSKFRELAALIQTEQFDRALSVFARLPQSEQKDDRIRIILGYLLILEGRNKEAVSVLSELVEQVSGSFAKRYPLSLYLLAYAERELGRYRDAFDHFLSYDEVTEVAAERAKEAQPQEAGPAPAQSETVPSPTPAP